MEICEISVIIALQISVIVARKISVIAASHIRAIVATRRVSVIVAMAGALSLWGLVAQAQQPVASRERPAVARGGASLSGTVVSDEQEPRPIRRARVSVGSSEPPFARTLITDDRGRFIAQDLPAGRYTVMVSKSTWVTTSYGARQPRRPGTPIPLAEGQKAAITIKLPRGAVITGVVVDQNGQPEGNVVVRVMRYAIQNGERRLVPAGQGTTDDRGAYRIWGLAPGDYVVGGTSRATPSSIAGGEVRLTTDLDVRHAASDASEPPPPDRTVSISTTYYPGTAVASQAALVSVRAGEERGGIDFALQLVPTTRIEGSIASPIGPSAFPSTQVNLMAMESVVAGLGLEGFRSARPGADGTFAFTGITPGSYTVLARSAIRPPDGSPPGTPPQILWATTDLNVEGDAVSGLTLVLQPAMTLTGRVSFEGTSLTPPADMKAIRITLQPVQQQGGASMAPGFATMEPDGRFTMAGVIPGRYRLNASVAAPGRTSGWIPRSAMLNGQDALDVPIVIQGGQPPGEAIVTISDRLADVTGTLQNAAGGAAPDYTVILFPQDQAMWQPQSRRIRAVRASVDGTFALRNLPAGSYLLAAVDDVEQGEWYDPSFLQRLQPNAMPVVLDEGERKAQDVRVGG